MIAEAVKEVKQWPHISRYLEGIAGIIEDLKRDRGEKNEMRVSRHLFLDRVDAVLHSTLDQGMNYDRFVSDLSAIGKETVKKRNYRAYTLDIANFLEQWKNEYESCLRVFRHEKSLLSYKVLDPSVLSKDIFESVHSSILMSGTLFPTEMYMNVLGLEEKETVLETYLSPFPPENRPVRIATGVTTQYSKRGEGMYRNIAGIIEKISCATPKNLAVFFQSYGMLKSIARYISPVEKQVIIEERQMSKSEKDNIYTSLVEAKHAQGALLLGVMGASLSEGIDYDNNLLDATIIVGIPLAPPSIEVNAIIQYYTMKFDETRAEYYGYIYPAMNKVMQAAGRCIRSERDRAVVILMDYRFGYNRYMKCFPDDMKITKAARPEMFVQDFFGRAR